MPEDDRPADVSRPVVLYVERVDTRPEIQEYFETRRQSVIDIEIDPVQAAQIAEYLQERSKSIGSIRIRLTGRLIHL